MSCSFRTKNQAQKQKIIVMRQKKPSKQLHYSGTRGSQKFGDKYCYIISYACLALFVLKETYTNENYSSWTPGTQILHFLIPKELVPLKQVVKLRRDLSANDTSRHPKLLKIGPNHQCQQLLMFLVSRRLMATPMAQKQPQCGYFLSFFDLFGHIFSCCDPVYA